MRQRTLQLALVLGLGLLVVLAALPLTAQAQADDDWSRVQAAGKIVFGTSSGYPPFEYYGSDFQLDGFDIALARELGKRMGVEVEFNDFAFAGLIDALRLGQVDAAIGAISVTPDRQQIVDFTNLYYIGESAVLTLDSNPVTINSASEFAGLRVGVELGSIYNHWVQTNVVDAGLIPQEDIVTYADTAALVKGLRAGEIDAAVMDRLTAFVYNMGSQDLHPAGTGLNQERFAIATRTGSTLVTPLNEALLAIQSDGTYGDLVQRYLNLDADRVSNNKEESEIINLPQEPIAAKEPCIDGMAFVVDLNFDDRNMTAPPVMAPGQNFVKSWRIRNSGTCTWATDYQLVYVNGNRSEASMSAAALPLGREVQPGDTIDLSLSLVAPTTYGVFQGFFQLRDNTGKLFGEVIWVGIQVPNPNPPPATPTPPPAPSQNVNPNLRADADWVNSGQCTTIRWDVDNVQAVYFVDAGRAEGVGGHDARTVCPGQTATFFLRVIRNDGSTVEFPITINVDGRQPSRPGPSISHFGVDRNNIRPGECIHFDWRTENADGVNLYRGGTRIVTNGPQQGSFRGCPVEGRHDYRLEAYGNGNTSQTISVNVAQPHGGRDE